MAIANYFFPLKSKVKPKTKASRHWMVVIAIGRLAFGLILLAVGIAILNLIGKNLDSELLALATRWRIDAHLYYVHWLVQKAAFVSPQLLVWLVMGNFFYALLAFIETAGLVFYQRWAYWLVILDTASFIPIEIFQLYQGFGWINLSLLIYYFSTVIYLLWEIIRRPELHLSLDISPILPMSK